MIDPVTFRKILRVLLIVLVVLELVGAAGAGVTTGKWTRFAVDLIVVGVVAIMWDRISVAFRSERDAARKRIELAPQSVKLWEAFIFSLLWSDEIFERIPPDRKHIVVAAYTLLAVGVVLAVYRVGEGLMSIVIAGGVVLAAVNLLAWIVGSERQAKEDVETELRLAHAVQASLMPAREPSVPGFDVSGLSIPAREVGGDHFDYTFGDSRLGLTVFDVSGKGMEAAMTAVFTLGAATSEAARPALPHEMLSRINRAVVERGRKGTFVAYLLASIDTATRDFTFANAGQPRPLLRRNGTAQVLAAEGPTFPLGLRADSVYASRTIRLEPGDVVLLMSDGLPETMNRDREQLGDDAIAEHFASLDAASLPASGIRDALLGRANAHMAGFPQHDDITIVVVKVL